MPCFVQNKKRYKNVLQVNKLDERAPLSRGAAIAWGLRGYQQPSPRLLQPARPRRRPSPPALHVTCSHETNAQRVRPRWFSPSSPREYKSAVPPLVYDRSSLKLNLVESYDTRNKMLHQKRHTQFTHWELYNPTFQSKLYFSRANKSTTRVLYYIGNLWT